MSIFLFVASVSLTNAQEKKRPLAIEDLYLMESVKSPALFLKEEKLVYERVWIDAKTKKERHKDTRSIQRLKLTGATRLVSRGMKVLQAAPADYHYRSAANPTGETWLQRSEIDGAGFPR
jgi:hypothetical protein